MLKTKYGLSAAIITIVCSQGVQADWTDIFKDAAEKIVKEKGGEVVTSALSESEIVSGLKEALANGVESAINTLGQPGGFAGNKLVEIAVPDSLKTIAKTARTLGQGSYVDSFESSMNSAAEKAVPEAATILSNAIRDMSVTDAMNILNGSDDAATQYFRKASEASLVSKFKPIVTQATDSTGVTSYYKQLTGKVAPLLGGLLNNSSLDLDQYVTDEAMDGLFQYIAKEEKSIRDNPAARTTDILKKVFGK